LERVFITGSNRGIGLAVVEAYLERGAVEIFAACRQPENAAELQDLAKQNPQALHLIPLEVTEQASIKQAFSQVQKLTDALDIVINNAGVDPEGQSLEAITAETMMSVYAINTVAPVMVSKAFLPLLRKGTNPRLVQISTEMASLEDRTYGGSYAYCSSKAALNMAMRGMAADLRRQGIINIALDPGWVQTDMGGSSASLLPEESAAGILEVISKLKASDNGLYLAYDGSKHNW
jgi:NAD(P)-dependent dehydrogenase (short-subunit alcohol dehydrogenase family)